MVTSKKNMIDKLKTDITSIRFKTLHNHGKEGYQVGVIRSVYAIHSNALQLLNPEGQTPWIYFNDIDVKNNILTYKHFNIEIELIEEGGLK